MGNGKFIKGFTIGLGISIPLWTSLFGWIKILLHVFEK